MSKMLSTGLNRTRSLVLASMLSSLVWLPDAGAALTLEYQTGSGSANQPASTIAWGSWNVAGGEGTLSLPLAALAPGYVMRLRFSGSSAPGSAVSYSITSHVQADGSVFVDGDLNEYISDVQSFSSGTFSQLEHGDGTSWGAAYSGSAVSDLSSATFDLTEFGSMPMPGHPGTSDSGNYNLAGASDSWTYAGSGQDISDLLFWTGTAESYSGTLSGAPSFIHGVSFDVSFVSTPLPVNEPGNLVLPALLLAGLSRVKRARNPALPG